MTDPDDPLLFTPVPLQRRARGWSAEAQVAFIAALARTGVVAQAARSVACSPRSAYQLRAKPGAESFAAAWDWALEMGLDAARDRAFGIIHESPQRPLLRRGRVIGFRQASEARLMLIALRALGADLNGARDALPHRQRMAARELDERLADDGPPNPVDWGAVDLPWFDRSSIERGPAAVDAACRAARATQARMEEEADAPAPSAPADRIGPGARLL
ncbi:hypothetical protein WG907_02820 [Sphingobium sp. AN558]|uniref:hypothetical protein n=1 Tax=Sphingobium sp. AN558 TaxID=3133442 RepID=UPI0030C0A1CB